MLTDVASDPIRSHFVRFQFAHNSMPSRFGVAIISVVSKVMTRKEHYTSADGQNFELEGEALTRFQEVMEALGREEITLKVPVVKVSEPGEREMLTPAACYAPR